MSISSKDDCAVATAFQVMTRVDHTRRNSAQPFQSYGSVLPRFAAQGLYQARQFGIYIYIYMQLFLLFRRQKDSASMDNSIDHQPIYPLYERKALKQIVGDLNNAVKQFQSMPTRIEEATNELWSAFHESCETRDQKIQELESALDLSNRQLARFLCFDCGKGTVEYIPNFCGHGVCSDCYRARPQNAQCPACGEEILCMAKLYFRDASTNVQESRKAGDGTSTLHDGTIHHNSTTLGRKG
jgi:hypothetical protein